MLGALGSILGRNGEKMKEENNMFPGDMANKTHGCQEGSLKLEYPISLIFPLTFSPEQESETQI